MPVTAARMQTYDHSVGDVHEPERGIRPLEYNIINMRLGKLTMGTRKWWNAFFDVMHLLGYDDIERICLGRRIPAFIAKRLDPQHKAWINSAKNNSDVKRIGKPPSHNSRIRTGLNVLRDAPPSQLGFITVVADFAGTEADAIRWAETNAISMSSFIRRRFDHAVCVLLPEIDLKVAKSVDDALLPRVGWKVVFDPEQRIYKIHFHGVIYVPGHSPSDIENAFRFNKNGKRNRSYSGANQVRVIPMNEAPGYDDGTADIDGVAGYCTKYHYRPPVMTRMLEGFISWLVVTSAVIDNPKATVVVGMRKGVQVLCKACETFHGIDEVCACPSILTPIVLEDFYGANPKEGECVYTDVCDQIQPMKQPTKAFSNRVSTLNSAWLSIWDYSHNIVRKKLSDLTSRQVTWGRPLFRYLLFPRGP